MARYVAAVRPSIFGVRANGVFTQTPSGGWSAPRRDDDRQQQQVERADARQIRPAVSQPPEIAAVREEVRDRGQRQQVRGEAIVERIEQQRQRPAPNEAKAWLPR